MWKDSLDVKEFVPKGYQKVHPNGVGPFFSIVLIAFSSGREQKRKIQQKTFTAQFQTHPRDIKKIIKFF